jgi:hypothetical protein
MAVAASRASRVPTSSSTAPSSIYEYHFEPIQPLHDETMARCIETIEPHEVTGEAGDTLFYHHV